MSDNIIITGIICVSIVSVVSIFAILAYLNDRATLKFKNNFKHFNNEISITTSKDRDLGT